MRSMTSGCYAGIGTIKGRKSAGDTLRSAVVGPASKDRMSIGDIADALAPEAERWLRGVGGDTRHSFSLSGIEIDGARVRTRVALVSNWQRLEHGRNGDLLTVDSKAANVGFSIDLIDVTEPILLVTGMHPALGREARLRLMRLTRRRRTTSQLAHEMAMMNRVAAGHNAAQKTISPHCTSISMLLSAGEICGTAFAHTRSEGPVVTPLVNTGPDDSASWVETVIADHWRKEGRSSPPKRRPSMNFYLGFPCKTKESPYRHKKDHLYRSAKPPET